ncbi:MAG: lamin tail domain-containing protein, partial [Candidatus Hinthialibacter sp.]
MIQFIIGIIALLCAAIVHAESTIVINEIMYHPVSDRSEDEYIELYNRGEVPVDLSGWYFSDGIRYSFPSETVLNPGEYLVVAQDARKIREKYGIDNVAGDYIGELSNSGERIILTTIDGETADEVEYSDSPPWPAAADELGPSLECINPNEDNARPGVWSVSRGFVDWTLVEAEGTIMGDSLQFYLENAGSAWLDDVQLYNLDAYQLEEAVWPMEYRHRPSGNQSLNMHFSHIRIPLNPNRRLLQLQLPNEPRIYLFGVTMELSDRVTSSSLSGFFNADGISGPDDMSDGSLDGGGSTYASELLPVDQILRSDRDPSIWWELGPYEDGQNNAVQCLGQTISIQRLMSHELHLLATAVNAQTITESLTIIYADGAEEAALQVTDWAVAVPESTSQGADIIQNGSFESGLTRWQAAGNHRTSQPLSSEKHSGSQALHLVGTGPGGEEGMVRQTLSGFQSGDRGRLQFWLRAGEGACKVIAEMSDGGLRTETLLGSEGSPGRINSVWQETLPPFVENYSHNPEHPASSDSVTITAQISGGEIIQSVSLQYTVNDHSQWVEMRDDGRSGDGQAQDGVYGAQLPPQPSQTPVFYSIHAADALHRIGRSPRASDPTPRHGYFVYGGEAPSDLPIYFLFVGGNDLSRLNSNPQSNDMVEAAVVVDGQVYDGVRVRYRGAWARSWPKKNWKIRFNKGRYYKGWRTSNLNGEYHD